MSPIPNPAGGTGPPIEQTILDQLRREMSARDVQALPRLEDHPIVRQALRGLSPPAAVVVLSRLRRVVQRAARAEWLKAWRASRGLDELAAARDLGLAFEDVQDIEAESIRVRKEAMRPILDVMKRIRRELRDAPSR